MHISRREWLLANSAFAAALALGPRIGRAAELRTVRFGVGLKAMSAAVINCVIGETLGYNKEENFTIKPLALGGNSNVQIAVDRGDVDIGIGVPSFQLPILAKGEWGPAINFYEYTYPYKWDVAVKPGSAIKSYNDLKGKRVGVSDFAASEYPVTRNVLRALGLDPDKDVKWISVGNGVPAGVALERDAIDALAYFDTGFGQIEAAGIKLEFLPRPEAASVGRRPVPDGQANAAQGAIAISSSASAARWRSRRTPDGQSGRRRERVPRHVPGNRSQGSSREAAVKLVLQTIGRRIQLYKPPYPNAKLGSINPQEFRTEAELNQLQLKNLDNFYTNELIDPINDFDLHKIQVQAMAYKP